MTYVHTQYGPGRIIASETVRGHRTFRVAGEGFEVWLDEAKLGGLDDDYTDARLAWAPMDNDNSTELPYNPEPQFDAIGYPGDEDSSTIQPIHNIDADERLHPSDSISFEDESEDEQPAPNPDLFARSAGLEEKLLPAMNEMWMGQSIGQQAGDVINDVTDKISDLVDAGPGWGNLIHDAEYRPAGLDSRYIDLTASVDYHNDPVAQFRHDPDAYINRIGHIMDEGLNPRFAEYMDLVEADGGIREAAWKDVRAKAMRLKREGHVHVKDLAPTRIMASVEGDHGTYDVQIIKAGSFGGTGGAQSIANWHCACEWGRWAFRRKFTFVGRLCSHAYASYLTMQSAAADGPKRRSPSDMMIVKRKQKDRYLPMTQVASQRTADALQNGPDRLTPELVVNDTDDTHIFLDVTKDERKDVGPDDVVSQKDIVHFSRLMAECDRNTLPYPRQLVAFLARYAFEGDDTQADYQAADANDAMSAISTLRSDADHDQESDFGSMADKVHQIQDAVEKARDNGADASQFVAMMRRADSGDPGIDKFVSGGGKLDNTPSPPAYDPGMALYQQNGGTAYSPNPSGNGTWGFNHVGPNGKGDTLPTPGKDQGAGAYAESDRRGVPRPGTGVDPALAELPQYKTQAPGKAAPATPSGQPSSAGGGQPSGGGAAAPSSAGGGASPSAAPAGGGAYGAPSGGMTTGPIADGGRPGAENGNNSAITGDSYTVQKGDTLSDIAQRAYGDMNKYQDIAKGNSISNPDVISEGQTIKLPGATGNNGLSGDVTNPASGGADGNKATVDTPKGPASSAAESGVNAGTSIGVDTSAASGKSTTPTSPSGGASTSAVPPADTSASSTPSTPAPGASVADLTPPPAKTETTASAKAWLRWAAESDGGSDTSSSGGQSSPGGTGTGTGTATPPASNPASPTAGGTRTNGTGGVNTGTDPNVVGTGNLGGFDLGPLTDMIGQGANAASNLVGSGIGAVSDALGGAGSLAQGIGGIGDMASSIGSGIGNAISGIGSILGSKQDYDEWVRYAYPADMDNTEDPKLLPHHPFNGSGYAGPLEVGSSQEYADKARKGMEDVTDLDYDVHADLGDLQKQSSYDGYDDDSDIVRSFQASMGGSFDAPSGGGQFDDIAGAAQGFLRTAGRNYSLAEQDELIREGDKGGARNLASLDLAGTHYEDMTTLGW